ncbi:hypothetical protein BD413DRAFT_318219 [Trametes elegans]|nr:hypothetical protein BD413DRAFT_318219 [Trametes elegans]
MGRPLFSSRQPAVRVQPEAHPPAYEKWTYANAFDPDSDEFFENDDAVYEAFIDPGQQIQLPPSPAPPRTIIHVETGSSSSSSEGTSSGRGRPMETTDAEVLAREERTGVSRLSDAARLPIPTPRNGSLDAQIDAADGLPAEERVLYYLHLLDRMEAERLRRRELANQAQETLPSVRDRIPTYLELPQEEPRTPISEPVPRVSLAQTPPRPSTPPTLSTPRLVSPSPPPSVTPRLYSWTSFATPSVPPPTSPLTNHGARVSVARIAAPSLVPVHRAA